MAAISTIGSHFMQGTGTGTLTWADLCRIKDYPDFLNDINPIDITDLQNSMHTYMMGLKDTGGDMSFNANYSVTGYQAVKALEGAEQDLAIWFGGTKSGETITPTGTDGKWSFKGMISVGLVGGGVDAARQMTIHVTPTSDMTFSIT